MMAATVKFEGVDILDSLGQIMELHTQHYKEDFDMDKELIPRLAASADPEDKHLLWMSRPCGTYTLREWEVYLEGSHDNRVWRFYHEQTKDEILAYALRLDGIQDGKVTGDIYPLDYHAHVERMKLLACPIEKAAVLFEDGTSFTVPCQNRRPLMDELIPEHGKPKSIIYLPESERELTAIMRRERFKRNYHANHGDIKEYMDGLKKHTLREKLAKAKKSVSHANRQPHRKETRER